jgi:hypothetical protein
MAIELQIGEDWTGTNVANANFAKRNIAVDIDVSNSTDIITAVQIATTSANAVGISYDESKLDPSGAVQKNSGVTIRTWGIARAHVSAAVTAGDLLKVSGTDGRMAGASTSSNWQNLPLVGRALQSASGSSSLPLVLLTIGARI